MASGPGETSSLLPGGNQRYNQPAGPTFERALFPTWNNPFTPAALAAADKRARRRFALTLVLGFLLWLLLGLFVGIVGGEGAWWGDSPYRQRWPGTLDPIPVSDGNVTYCANFLKTLPTSVIVIPPGKEHFYMASSSSTQLPAAWWSADIEGVTAVDGGQSEDTEQSGSIRYSNNGVTVIGSGGSSVVFSGRSSSSVISNIVTSGNSHVSIGTFGNVYSNNGQSHGGWQDVSNPSTIYKSKVYFQYDVNEDNGFYILAHGLYSGGPVRYVVGEPKAPKDVDQSDGPDGLLTAQPKIEVEVTARWNDKELLKSSKVCALSRNAGSSDQYKELGLGIYTPAHNLPGPYRHLSFETVVRFPPSGLDKLRSLALQGTNIGPIDIDIESVSFDRVRFSTSNGGINAQSLLHSASAEILTSNGNISGDYSTSEHLSLESTNGRIDADVYLVKAVEDDKTAHIDVKAHTSNGKVFLDYVEHPVGVILKSSVRTTNGEVGVTHPAAFEGDLELTTSWGRGNIKTGRNPSDPAGQHRERHLKLTRDENGLGRVRKEGSIYWGETKNIETLGRTVVQNTNGAASLNFA